MENQDRNVKEVLASINDRSANLDKRLSNLETSEFSLLNYYGSMSQYNLGTVIAVALASTYYLITGMVTGPVRAFTFAASQLTCSNPGIYRVTYHLSVSNLAAKIIRAGVHVNDTLSTMTVQQTYSGGTYQHINGGGLIDLAIGDIIDLRISNETDATNPVIVFASIYLNKVGD